MPRPPWEVADVMRRYGEAYRKAHQASISCAQLRVMEAIETCRTAALGGHVELCQQCGARRICYNSCRNRHCPKCQSLAKARWLEARLDELLPVEHFHVVFTLPKKIATIGLYNKRLIYNLLFRTAAETLRTIAADPRHLGAEIGFLAVLHTWGQRLDFHPHLHCIVPGGGFDAEGRRWISCRPGFFLPVRVLSRLYRRLFLQALETAHRRGEIILPGDMAGLEEPEAFHGWLEPMRRTEWVVYAKKPFGGPRQVLDYLGRYTHRVAISNHRLLDVENGKVTFKWRDYRHRARQRSMCLDAEEFIRRFLLHVLPDRFVRIRHFGFLANRHRAEKLEAARELLQQSAPAGDPQTPDDEDWKTLLKRLTGEDPELCPQCRQGKLVRVQTLSPGLEPWQEPEGIDSS